MNNKYLKKSSKDVYHSLVYVYVTIIAIHYLGVLASNLGDPDLWGYLAFGRLFWNELSFPYHDVFSYMPVKDPWIYHEWLTGVIYYPIYTLFGPDGLQALRYIVALTALAFTAGSAKTRGAHPGAIFLCLYLSVYVFAFGYSPVRAQVFTYMFFAITLFVLEQYRTANRSKLLITLIPLQVLWCNLHGGFVAGLGMILLYAIGEAISRQNFFPYLTTFLASALVTLINPYGLDYWLYTFDAVTMPRPEITEWLSVYAGIQQELSLGAIFSFFTLILFTVVLFAIYNKRDVTTGLVLFVTACLGLRHIRHIVFFALAFMVYAPAFFTLFWGSLKQRMLHTGRIRIASFIAGLFLLFILCDSSYTFYKQFITGSPFLIQTTSKGKNGRTEYHFPDAATRYIITNGLKGNILPFFDWGEYLIWNLYPDCKVGMDGRYETVYPDMIHRAYFDFIYGREGWREFLYGYPHDMIIVKAGTIIHHLLSHEKDWVEVQRMQGTALFIRKDLLPNNT